MRTPRRIVIVDNNPTSSEDFRSALESQTDLILADAVTCASCSFRAVSQQKPHLVILSLSMPGHRILELVKDLTVLHAGLKLLVAFHHGLELDSERVLRAGAHGCVMSDSSIANKLAAVRQILAGGNFFSPQINPRPSSAASLHKAAFALGGLNLSVVV